MAVRKLQQIHVCPVRIIVALLAFLAVIFVATQFTSLTLLLATLSRASWGWISLAVAAMAISIAMGAAIQYVAGNSVGRRQDLIRLSVAGIFVNRFLPFSLGGIGLTADYYQSKGLSKSQSIVAATIPIAAGAVTTSLIALVVSPATIVTTARTYDHLWSSSIVQLLLVIIAGLCLVTLVIFRRRLAIKLSGMLMGLRTLHSFRQSMKIVAGLIIMTTVAAFVLYASVRAVGVDFAFSVAMVVFITSVLVSEITPTPGGIGATEAVTIIGLTTAGLTVDQAVAATIIFRFVSYLLPMIPGAVALSQLQTHFGRGSSQSANTHARPLTDK